MRTHYVRHLANIIDIRWSRPVWGGGGRATDQKIVITLRFQTNMVQYSRLSMEKPFYSKFNFFVKIIQTISNFYICHKYMTYHIYYSIFLK